MGLISPQNKDQLTSSVLPGTMEIAHQAQENALSYLRHTITLLTDAHIRSFFFDILPRRTIGRHGDR